MAKPKLCQFCGESNVYAKGLCRNCYERNRLHGSPEHKRGKPGERVKAVLDVYRTSRSYTNAAKELNVSRQYVQQVVRKYYKPTNAYRIRAMSDEELASLLVHNPWMTEKSALDWLKREVDNG